MTRMEAENVDGVENSRGKRRDGRGGRVGGNERQ